MNCDNCKHTRTCTRVWRNSKKECPHYIQTTNADHIRSMTDEELAKWLVLRTVYQESAWSAPSYLNFKTGMDDTLERAIEGTADWLKQPYKEYT